jgi:hypothetical protein
MDLTQVVTRQVGDEGAAHVTWIRDISTAGEDVRSYRVGGLV